MPAKEIKELRQSGRLEEAYAMAKSELDADFTNIWGKRNMSWVLYSQLDAAANNLTEFLLKIEEVKQLDLPSTEDMFFDNLSIVISKAARVITHETQVDLQKLFQLFDAIKDLPLKKSSKWYSVLFGAFQKGMKGSYRYIEFADWWGFENFKPEDYLTDKLPNGKEVMSIAEQAYIAYAKKLLPIITRIDDNNVHLVIPEEQSSAYMSLGFGNTVFKTIFDKNKAKTFLPLLSEIVDNYPQFQYPSYFKAKLLLALGEKDNLIELLLPLALKKRNDFWVWEILGEAINNEPDKVFACYCKALSCHSPEDMLVNLRQKMAGILISKKLFNEAKTEIDLLVESKNANGFKIPNEVFNWQSQDWYKNANAQKSNTAYYKQFLPIAESILYSDTPEETVIVEFVNSDRKILNFIASETKFGFFKYERFFKDVKIGETLNVRFQGGSTGGMYQIYTAVKLNNDDFKQQFLKEVEGEVNIPDGKPFGFLGDAYIHPTIISRLKLTDRKKVKGRVMKTYNPDKKQWNWKVIEIQ